MLRCSIKAQFTSILLTLEIDKNKSLFCKWWLLYRQRKVHLKMTIAPQMISTNGTILQKLSISTIIAGIWQKWLCASILDISTGIISLNCDRFAHKNYPYANYTVCCLHCQRWDHYSWPQQACPRDGGRPGDAQVQSAIAEKHVYCVKNLLALPCLTSIWYSIYMYLPRQTSFDLRKQHLDFRLLVLVLRCLLNPIHRLLVFVSLSFCFSVFSPVCLS